MKKGDLILCFDFDGTIVDTAEIKFQSFLEVFSFLSKDKLIKAKKILFQNQGLPRKQKFEKIFTEVLNKDITKENISELSSKLDSCIKSREKGKINLLGDIKKFLKKYNGQILFFITSAAPKNEIICKLKKTDILKYFEKVSGSEISKETFLREIKKIYLPSSKNIYMIGDNLSDLNAAKNSGVKFIGYGNNKEMNKSANISISNYFQLVEILGLKNKKETFT